jgi:hypothetical protein
VDFAERAARNEEVFRSVNQHIQAGADRHGRHVALRFHCECGHASCFETIDLMPDAYERVANGDGHRFIVLHGHEEPAIERIVESHHGWLVVEKFGDARAEIDREREG